MHDKLPPHSVEAEQGVLGSLFLERDTIGEAIEALKAGPEAFYDLRHRAIYEVLISMYDQKEAIDTITVSQRLRDMNQLDSVGGGAFVSSLPDKVPSAANISFYLNTVREKHVLRSMIKTCTSVIHEAMSHEGEVDGLMDNFERDILSVSDLLDNGSGQLPIKQLVRDALSALEELHDKQGSTIGLATGFPDIDRMTNGFVDGDMVVIAARPSVGKTSLAMNIVENICVTRGVPVGVFSLEMTARSLTMRMLCSLAQVNVRDVQSGFMVEKDFKNLAMRAAQMAKAPLYIDDSTGLSILQLRAKARRMHQRYGIKMLVVDYLQLLNSTSRRADNRQQEIADISGGLKSLGKELNIPVVVLSQLNRDLEKDKSRKPRLSDLRESGAIEQDADLVAMLYRQEQADDEKAGPCEVVEAMPVGFLITKQRNGATGEVNLIFRPKITRFESAARV